MLTYIDQLINNITMYKLTLYGLLVLCGGALILSLTNILSYPFLSLVASFSIIISTAYIGNMIAAYIWRAPANPESSLITACILFLLMAPASTLSGVIELIVVTVIAITSKYIIAYRHRHIFNPAAFGAFLAPFVTGTTAIWWVGDRALLPLTLILGLIVIRKIRRYALVISLFIAAFIGVFIRTTLHGNGSEFIPSISELFLSWPIVFFASIMLTEPLTTPPTRILQILYGTMVGLLFTTPFQFGPFYNRPEFVLLLGNIYTFLVTPNKRLHLAIKHIEKIAVDTYHITFHRSAPFAYHPGQYMEWTVPHNNYDSRGIRRYFTIASAPHEPLSIGVKIREDASSFKKELKQLSAERSVIATGLYGDFILPKDTSIPLVWIAGGIGITPFRAMAKHMLQQNEKRHVVLFYSAATPEEFSYMDIFEQAKVVGITTIPVLTATKAIPPTWSGEHGFLTTEIIQKHVPNIRERQYYISGPNAMVVSYKKLLKQLNVPSSHIHTDYFPGF